MLQLSKRQVLVRMSVRSNLQAHDVLVILELIVKRSLSNILKFHTKSLFQCFNHQESWKRFVQAIEGDWEQSKDEEENRKEQPACCNKATVSLRVVKPLQLFHANQTNHCSVLCQLQSLDYIILACFLPTGFVKNFS